MRMQRTDTLMTSMISSTIMVQEKLIPRMAIQIPPPFMRTTSVRPALLPLRMSAWIQPLNGTLIATYHHRIVGFLTTS